MDGLVFNIDAGRAGNETRFINHPEKHQKPNCGAEWKYVGGELRLGIYALKHIYLDQELLLDYGKEFFPTIPQPNPSETGSTPQYEDDMVVEHHVGRSNDDDESEYESVADSDRSASS
ncbi:hypothetical protein FRC08_010342 [Ceratobasidium sp. 394]|nr:hypothetical protein FRC08_010342 [Ceratobasidium sp. 394]